MFMSELFTESCFVTFICRSHESVSNLALPLSGGGELGVWGHWREVANNVAQIQSQGAFGILRTLIIPMFLLNCLSLPEQAESE